MTEREEKVLRLRFGLYDGRTRTLEEVGKEFNVTRERIRQIEAKALRKFQRDLLNFTHFFRCDILHFLGDFLSRSKRLKDFVDKP